MIVATLTTRGCGDHVVSGGLRPVGDQLAQLVDAGVPAKEAAAVIGLSRQRCYAIPRAIGRPVGRTGTADPRQIVTVYRETGSITRAATASGVSQSVARRILAAEGLVGREKTPQTGKPEAKRRCPESDRSRLVDHTSRG